jgi:hypothetical protein
MNNYFIYIIFLRYTNDLLLAKDFVRLLRNPSLLSEDLENMNSGDAVVIDEIQKIPQLLRAYISVYLHEEIREDALSRHVKIFARFMEIANYLRNRRNIQP